MIRTYATLVAFGAVIALSHASDGDDDPVEMNEITKKM
jgi:hypothetical protein